MPRLALAVVIVTVLCGTIYLFHNRGRDIGAPCGGDFHVKACPGVLVCVPIHPWSGGMGTRGTCQPPVNPGLSSSTAPFPQIGSKLIVPVQGPIAYTYNEPTRTGGTSRGIVWEPVAPSDVYSPGAGYVVHAGDFRGYGNLVIIQASGGYHLMIAGLSALTVENGDAVQPGTLIGTATTESEEPSRDDGSRAVTPTIYFELRKDGQPIDPSPWLNILPAN